MSAQLAQAQALEAAMAAIYFADSSDYLPALWDVVRSLSPEIAELAERDARAAWEEADALAAAHEAAPQQEPERLTQVGARASSPTSGMTIAQRIRHVGGRNNAAGYIEFGSTQAVEALVPQVLRDLPDASESKQPQVQLSEYRRGWNECMALWADHMKRMNAVLNRPIRTTKPKDTP